MSGILVALAIWTMSSTAPAQEGAVPCPRQPMPPAIDSAGPWDVSIYTSTIAFSATPSLEYPGRPWVVRLYRRGQTGEGTLQIFRLRRQLSCNRYDIEQRWEAPVSALDYRQILDAVVPLTVPKPETFTDPEGQAGLVEVALDGTGIDLRVGGEGFQVTRAVHLSAPNGAAASAIFYKLVAHHVPEEERPTDDWRTNSPPTGRR